MSKPINKSISNHVATWFEIPVTDMERAKKFYSHVMQTGFKNNDMEDMKMAIFSNDKDSDDCDNHNEPIVSGMLVANENYQPSRTSTVIYLNGGKDLTAPLERAIQHGGEVLYPKTAINDGECGYFAQFLDSEGNRVGLYSMA